MVGKTCPFRSTSRWAVRAAVRRRSEVPAPAAYAVFDCETTGTDPGVDEIVSLAVIRLDADGVETGPLDAARSPVAADPGRSDGGSRHQRRGRRRRAALRRDRRRAASSCSPAPSSSPTTRPSTSRCSSTRSRAPASSIGPPAVACTLDAFRLLEPLAPDHRLESICERRGIALVDAHDALERRRSRPLRSCACSSTRGIAPETVELDHAAFMRLRSRGDTRPATEPQIRRVFALARRPGLLADGSIDRDRVVALVERVAGHGRRRRAHPRTGAGRLRRARPAHRGPGRAAA